MTGHTDRCTGLGSDWITPVWPAPLGVGALMTLRSGGESGHPYTSWNLGDHVGDDPATVQRNRETLARATATRPVFLKQVHGLEVVTLDALTPDGTQADAAVTTLAGVACTMMVADCLPVLFASTDGSQVGAAHAGWRGLLGGVLEATVSRMSHGPSGLMAWLGPCIGPTAFEVGNEVQQAFTQQDSQTTPYFVANGDKWWADLPGLARYRLVRAGLAQSAIYGNDGDPEWCTVGKPQRYFSHRRDTAKLGATGRMAACIWRYDPSVSS